MGRLQVVALVGSLLGGRGAAAEAPAPLPLPPGAGVAAVDPGEVKTVRMDVALEGAERFYRQAFARVDGVTVTTSAVDGQPALVLTSRRPADAWGRAVLTREEGRTVVRVTPFYRLETVAVEGSPPPWVRIVIPRSAEARRALAQEHLVKK